MAKAPGPGFVDKHIEKVIFGICLVVLVYSIMRFGVSTPRRLEVISGQNPVPPKEVDTALRTETTRLDKRILAQKPEIIPPRQDMAALKQMQDQPISDQQSGLVLDFGSPPAQGIGQGPEGVIDKAPPLSELIAVMPVPSKPDNWSGEELMFTEETVDDELVEKLNELPTWRAVVRYPWKQLEDAWANKLEKTVVLPRVVALGYEVEIQEKQPDGNWKVAEKLKPVLLPITDDRGEVIKPDPIPAFTGENGDVVREAIRDFGLEWTVYQLQPDYHSIWTKQDGQTDWTAHFPFDVLKVFPEQKETEKPQLRKKKSTRAKAKRTTRKKTPLPRGRASASRRRSSRGGAMGMEMEMMGMEMELMEGKGDSRRRGRDVRTRRADKKRKTRKKTTKSAKLKKQPGDEEEEIPPRPEIPDIDSQLSAGNVLAWFHANSLQIGREYRCRFRLVFANPLLTYGDNVAAGHPDDATTPSVKTKWSPWSEPISVSRQAEFFVTGANPRLNELTVTIFTKFLGQRIMHRMGGVKPGQEIRGKTRVKVINPATEELKKDENDADPLIDFDTAAVAVKFNFNKRIATGAAIKNDGVEMIYLDSMGKLRSRVMYFDRKSPRYKELLEEAEEARQQIEPDQPIRKAEKSRKTKPRKRGGDMPDFMKPPAGGRGGMEMEMGGEMEMMGAPRRGSRRTKKKR